jgi:hypothetical protein
MAQVQGAAGIQPESVQVVVSASSSGNPSVVAIPPATSWTATIGLGSSQIGDSKVGDLSSWVEQQNALNGLRGLTTPWHIVIAYEQFDEDGDKVHSGTYDEIWEGPKKYKVSYKADDLNQTDYATALGLYRLGDQQWPNRAQTQIPKEVISPFFYAATLRGVHVRAVSEKFGNHTFSCALIENGPGRITSPTQYCFDLAGSELRYSRGSGWYQTTYNDLTSFSGRSVANAVDVYNGGKPYLKLRVQRLEAIANVSDADLTPPAEATNLGGQRLSGVFPIPLEQSSPDWPSSLRQQHFSVTVEIVIGKDGHVLTAHAISGPQDAFNSAEATARKWTFEPYMVLEEPAELITKIVLSNN